MSKKKVRNLHFDKRYGTIEKRDSEVEDNCVVDKTAIHKVKDIIKYGNINNKVIGKLRYDDESGKADPEEMINNLSITRHDGYDINDGYAYLSRIRDYRKISERIKKIKEEWKDQALDGPSKTPRPDEESKKEPDKA